MPPSQIMWCTLEFQRSGIKKKKINKIKIGIKLTDFADVDSMTWPILE